jgi:arylformamidase
MNVQFSIQQRKYTADLSQPIDISIPLENGNNNPNCFYAPHPKFEPVRNGNFVGATSEGGVVNFFNVFFNPHGNGTHTECVGHIAKETYTINQCLKKFHFAAVVVSVTLIQQNEDRVITAEALENACSKYLPLPDVLVIRTLPNDASKKTRNYSGTNPPYVTVEAMQWIVANKVQHLALDLPSVDREEDEGILAAHHIFWNYPSNPRLDATITELVYLSDEVANGFYLCNIQVTSIGLDASPSKLLLFPATPM